MILSCLIVDDESLGIEVLRKYVQQTSFLELKGTFNNPVDALAFMEKQPVDLVFLDIEMEELSGIQFIKSLTQKPAIIIVSAYNQYAIEGYEHDVAGYLLKPVPFDRFYKAAQKVLNQKQLEAASTQPVHEADYIFVKADSKMIKVAFGDILFVEGLKNYLSVFLLNGKRLVTHQNMRTMEELLPQQRFMRVHKSYIIALDKIDSIERQRIFIGDKIIPVGETYAPLFFQMVEKRKA